VSTALAERALTGVRLGTRHRAALGLSEQTTPSCSSFRRETQASESREPESSPGRSTTSNVWSRCFWRYAASRREGRRPNDLIAHLRARLRAHANGQAARFRGPIFSPNGFTSTKLRAQAAGRGTCDRRLGLFSLRDQSASCQRPGRPTAIVPDRVGKPAVGLRRAFYRSRGLVTVATKRGEPGIKAEEIKAVSTSPIKATASITFRCNSSRRSRRAKLSPASVTLTIERLEDRAFPIVIHYVGSLSRGVVVNAVRVRPSVATVRAPTSAQVSGVSHRR